MIPFPQMETSRSPGSGGQCVTFGEEKGDEGNLPAPFLPLSSQVSHSLGRRIRNVDPIHSPLREIRGIIIMDM